MRPLVAAGEEPARAWDTALPMLAVAGPDNKVLEGIMLIVSVKGRVSVTSRLEYSVGRYDVWLSVDR